MGGGRAVVFRRSCFAISSALNRFLATDFWTIDEEEG
jgi:hypothetical protein